MRLKRAAAVAIAASTLSLISTGTADAQRHVSGFTAFDQRLLADMNAARAEHGLEPFELSAQLQPVAYSWAQRMAAARRAYDNPRFARAMRNACPGWRHVGEAVGRAGEATADQLFDLYIHDASGRQTILSRKFHVVGVSTVATDYDGVSEFWNAIEFSDRCSR
jgi:uncharacterized protein YkwD